MDTEMAGLYVIIAIHFFGFFIYLPTLKFVLKKSVPFRMVAYYVIAFMIGLLIVTLAIDITVLSPQGNLEIDYAFLMGELVGYGIAFLIFDTIIWYMAKWLYGKIHTKKNDKKTNMI